MDYRSIEILFAVFGFVAFGVWIVKFGVHLNYREDCEPAALLPGLQKADLSTFVNSSYKNWINRIISFFPFIIRNKEAEARVNGLEKRGKIIVYLCLLFLVLLSLLITMSVYFKIYDIKPNTN